MSRGHIGTLLLAFPALATCAPREGRGPEPVMPPTPAPASPPAATAAEPSAPPPPPASASAEARATNVVPGAKDRLLLLGSVVTPTGAINGQLLIVGNKIACVAASCDGEPDAAGATRIATRATIYPGLIDAHNHGLFNIFDEDDWKPTKFYKNHNLWTAEARYKVVVDAKQFLEGEGKLRCELDKYAEVKALISGTTSMVVASGAQQPACFSSAVRTIDTSQNDLGTDKVQTSISVPDETNARKVCDNAALGKVDAYVVHTAEGVDETSRKEFDRLTTRAGGCLASSKTTIVHGTALGTPEFTKMASAGMRLVWSPKSNMFLYNDTTKVNLALAAGVQTIAIAPDWALGGSVNMLDELRYADQLDDAKFGNVLTPKRIFEMGTIEAAKALAVDRELGSLEVGKRADLFVVDGTGDAYQLLLKSTPKTVRLVVVDGRVLFGDAAFKAAAQTTPPCEALSVCGKEKFACVAEASADDKLNQTFAQIRQALEAALSAYDASVSPAGGPLSPLAPLTKCSD